MAKKQIVVSLYDIPSGKRATNYLRERMLDAGISLYSYEFSGSNSELIIRENNDETE